MSALLRPIEPDDHAFVLELNERNVEVLSPMDGARLEALLGWAHQAVIIQHDGERAGFVLTFASGADYDSGYYRWFSERFDDFRYLDRVVIDEPYRRLGLGARTYAELEKSLGDVPLLLEVNVDPPNEASLAFHAGRGYVEVSRLGPPGRQVSMMRGPNRSVQTT
ncbi:GNAT family N-acetyltransferase [Nocardioides alcanivorans]|uniref:GNAT family N-acetyltransferase n=1 Tax=Nocardioides alcanivorans TaxID=2897352 RepID=UPI001F42C393|nr:GNAT family N-acetyltransferase [Nocardioides alcanivorans]